MRSLPSLQYQHGTDTWEISNCLPHIAIKLKNVFPKIPKYSTGPFNLKATPDTAADLKWFSSRYPFEMSAKDKSRLYKEANHYKKHKSHSEEINAPNYTPKSRIGLVVGQIFRPHQNRTLDFIEHVKSALVIDDIGLGKSYTALGVGLIPGALPLVIVVEPHLQLQFAQKAKSFINLETHCIKGTKPYKLPPADIYIVKYTQLAGWCDVLASGWVKAICFDEVQQLRRGRESAKGIAAENICKNVPIRVGLTATLVMNYGSECFHIANILRPNVLGSQSDFMREWCGNDVKGIVKDPDALGSYLIHDANLVIRHTRADVGQSAKQTAPHIEYVEPDSKNIAAAEELAEQLAIRALTSNFNESGIASREFDLQMRQMTGIAKAKHAAAMARLFIESGKSVILYGWHKAVYEIWARELSDLEPLWFTGSESPTQKERSKNEFINSNKPRILIMSLRSGAGTDGLQKVCSTVIFGELDWSPKIHQQATGRVDREGGAEEVHVCYIVTKTFGSDPAIMDTLGVKTNQNRGITDPYEEATISQSNGNRIREMAKQYLNKRGIKFDQSSDNSLSSLSNEELAEML
ncbi:DEAD/DEAH box helicase [Vibrio owensii]|uniref:DEAD/DEAH box helicase n=1 Tax=Vibrio owensii TaxID=696485 RepID=UPI0018F18FD7|nr:DEAD/DEAH box helicase [Vibrio owensii]